MPRILWSFVALLALMGHAHAASHDETQYLLHCSGCHGPNGNGVPEKGIPNLHESWKYVGTTEGRQYLVQVPGIAASRLSDDEAAATLNWVISIWSDGHLPNGFAPFTGAEVTQSRAGLQTNAPATRAALLGAFNAAHPGEK